VSLDHILHLSRRDCSLILQSEQAAASSLVGVIVSRLRPQRVVASDAVSILLQVLEQVVINICLQIGLVVLLSGVDARQETCIVGLTHVALLCRFDLDILKVTIPPMIRRLILIGLMLNLRRYISGGFLLYITC
jgi:hypothetical protein